MGHTAVVTVIVIHGAGSSGRAAEALLGPRADMEYVEDRTGSVEHVAEAVDAAFARASACAAIVGISLGAHALARWASHQAPQSALPRLVFVLPAWTGQPGRAAAVTAAASDEVQRLGSADLLARLAADSRHPDVVELLGIAWSDYSDEALIECLRTASEGHGPTDTELSAIDAPSVIVGWHGDDFHPAQVTRQWSQHLRHSTVAMAARPEVRLLRAALATVGLPALKQDEAARRDRIPPRAGA